MLAAVEGSLRAWSVLIRGIPPGSVASFQYPKAFETWRLNNGGDIRWHKGRVFFCNTELGEFNSSEMRFRPVVRPSSI